MKKKIVTTNVPKSGPTWELAGTPAAEAPATEPETRRRILRTTDLKRPEDPPNLNELGGGRTSAIDDKNFIGSQATAEELAALRKQIEDRQRPPAAPGPETILVCTNQRCRAWAAYEPKHVPRGLGSCIFCNHRNLKDGGQMRRATEAETTLFWSEKRRLQEIGKLRARQAQEAEAERRRLGIHQLIDHRIGPSIDSDPSIKRNR